MMTPEQESAPNAITAVEVIAYVVVALCLIFAINLALDWVGRQLGTDSWKSAGGAISVLSCRSFWVCY